MPREVVGNIPEFTPNEPLDTLGKEVKETPAEVGGKEKETPPVPPSGEKPEEEITPQSGELPLEDSEEELEKKKAIQGLTEEEKRLREEIVQLRTERRELRTKQQPILESQEQKQDDDLLKDINPDDLAIIEKAARAKGFVSRAEVKKEIYETIKQDELDKFLNQHPEFKPENDPNDRNWNALQRELGYYKSPENPRQVGALLEKARKEIQVPSSGGDNTEARRRQIKTASLGSTSAKSSPSSLQSFDSAKVEALRRGGWSDEEITNMLSKLNE